MTPILEHAVALAAQYTLVTDRVEPRAGASAGIGFAVPVNTVRRSVSQIIEFGRVQRGRVGLALMQDETNRQLRKVLSLPAGVIIQGVVPSSGAAQAGLRCGPRTCQIACQSAWSRALRLNATLCA